MSKIFNGISVNLKTQQILGYHKLKGHSYPNIIEATFSFPKFVASRKIQFIPTIHS